MADDNSKLLIVLEAQSKKLQNQLADASRTIDRFAQQTNRRFDAMNAKNAASFDKLNRNVRMSVGDLSSQFAKVFAGAAFARSAQQLLDANTRIVNGLKIAGLEGEALEATYVSLSESARRNGTSFEALAGLYAKASLAQKELGISADELAQFTDNVAVALRVAGTDAGAASGALLQLSQALGGGIVRAEEFNSILEGAPTIAQAVAAGLEEAGGSVSKLRNLVIEGEISSKAFFAAFQAGSVAMQQKASESTLTIGQAFENLKTTLITAAGEFDTSTGASASFAASLERLANAIDRLGNSRFVQWLGEVNSYLEGSRWGSDLDDVINELERLGGAFDKLGTHGFRAFNATEQLGQLENQASSTLATLLGFDSIDLVPADQQAQITALIERMKESEVSTDELAAALQALGLTPVDLTVALASLEELKGSLRETRAEAAATAAQVAAAAAGRSSTDNIADQRAEQLGLRPKAVAKVQTISTSDPGMAPPVSAGSGSKGGGGSKSPAQNFQDDLDAQQRRIDNLREETALRSTLNPLVDDYGFALERLQVQQDLLNAAEQAGLTVTPELRAKIDELATGYANASVEAEKLAQAQDNAKQMAEDFSSAAKDGMKGFITDLMNGKSAAEALGNALSSIGSKLLDIGLNSLFSGLGGGGGLLSGLFSKGFAGGGYTGSGGKHQPAGVVHKGEYVFNQDAVKRIGIGNLERLHRGFADGGYVGAPGPITPTSTMAGGGISVDVQVGVQDGQLVPLVTRVAGQVAGQQIKANNKRIPTIIRDYDRRIN